MKDKNELKCTLSPGTLLTWTPEGKRNRHFKLQIEGDYKEFVKKSQLKSYVKSKYGLTLKEYYNLVMYGHVDNSPKCCNPKCDEECGWDEHHLRYSEYCSKFCILSVSGSTRMQLGIHLFQNPEFIKKNAELSRVREKERMLKLWSEGKHQWQKPGAMEAKGKKRGEYLKKLCEKGENTFQRPEANMKTQLFRYHKLGCTEINAYLCILRNGNIKVGVSKDYVGRSYSLNTKFSSHSILRSSPENCTQLECDIKSKFCYKTTEEFSYDRLPEVIKYIKEFKQALN